MLKKNLLAIALVTVTAVAQTGTAPAKPTTATKPATTTAKQTSTPTKPASQAVPGKTSSKAANKTASAKATATSAKAAPAPKAASPAKVKADIQAKTEKPAAAKPPVKTAGRRDPFISPLRLQEDKKTTVCTTGVRCLIIDQVVLKGIVKTQQGMIAMVENASKKQYNLREKDPVFNGQVTKITGDSLIFRENMTDSTGHQSTREVVKRVTAPVI
jgi:Tfp pilus assembly protein PilP